MHRIGAVDAHLLCGATEASWHDRVILVRIGLCINAPTRHKTCFVGAFMGTGRLAAVRFSPFDPPKF
jgi:hypothetical protein